jgi:hypothetical protein
MRSFVEHFDDTSEVGETSVKPIDLVNDHDVDLAGGNVGKKLLESWSGLLLVPAFDPTQLCVPHRAGRFVAPPSSGDSSASRAKLWSQCSPM